MLVSIAPVRGSRHEPDRPGGDCVCGALACDLRGAASGVQLCGLAPPMRDGRAALYRAMGRRAPEMAGGALALRISASQRQGVRPDEVYPLMVRSREAASRTMQ